ncbi:MAG: hypothetical protein PHE17_10135 [Thiothrix sp.]|uniref:hypothetical protein n=1 Tax=Thiothrix sp. TaxID=1032 RepID=UPI0026221908|nr:hypothetical protein [Thiothrix sp.]MDD5393366.1 hypothetical protein [Thiothrix sp.]
MVSAETIFQKAQRLDVFRLQELADFLDFLLSKQPVVQKKSSAFPPTQIEWPQNRPVYQGKPLSIEEMDEAIEYEAGLHK